MPTRTSISIKRIFAAGLVWILSSAIYAQTTIDFKHSHDIQTILSSGIKLIEFSGDPGFLYHKGNNSVLLFRLPGGQEIQSNVESAYIHVLPDGKLSSFSFHSQILPIDEAYQIVHDLHNALNISPERLDQWLSENKTETKRTKTFSNGQRNYFPGVYIEILSSMNRLYPWYINVEFSWKNEKNDNRDEIWGATNNFRAPEGFRRILIDSPSGKIYDRKDAYSGHTKVSKEFWIALGPAIAVLLFLLRKRK
jgi:hypothetical protein